MSHENALVLCHAENHHARRRYRRAGCWIGEVSPAIGMATEHGPLRSATSLAYSTSVPLGTGPLVDHGRGQCRHQPRVLSRSRRNDCGDEVKPMRTPGRWADAGVGDSRCWLPSVEVQGLAASGAT